MARILAVVLVALVLGSCGGGGDGDGEAAGGPRVVAAERSGARVVDLTIDSPAVGRKVGVRLLLPRGFEREPGRRWPVLYLLHGCCDSYQSWTRSTDVERLSAGDGVLVVMPDGGRAGFYSDWEHGPAWEPVPARRAAADPRAALPGKRPPAPWPACRWAGSGRCPTPPGTPATSPRPPPPTAVCSTSAAAPTTRASWPALLQSEGEDPDALCGATPTATRSAGRPTTRATSRRACAARGCSSPAAPAGRGRSTHRTPRSAPDRAGGPARDRGRSSCACASPPIPARVDLYGPRNPLLAVLAARAAPQLAAPHGRHRRLAVRGRVAVVQHEHVSVRVAEMRHVADAAVDRVVELTPLASSSARAAATSPTCSATGTALGLNSIPRAAAVEQRERDRAGLELGADGLLAPLPDARLQAEHALVELARGRRCRWTGSRRSRRR